VAQRLTAKTSLASDDGEGWTVVTRRKPRKPKQTQAPPLRRGNRQGKKKNPRHARSKKKSKTNKREEIQPNDVLKQEPLVPVTLEEFFPTGFFEKFTINMTSCYKMEDEEDGDEDQLEESSEYEKGVLTIPKALPACMDWRKILNLSEKVRHQVVVALQHPELYADKVKDAGPSIKGASSSMKDVTQYTACNTAITFSDDDLLLDSKPHNHPLFVTGYIRERKVKRILVDGGYAVNIMPKSTMHDLGITADDLSKSQMVIQGFSLESQRAIGMIRLELTMGDLSTSSIFHVIDSKTSYKLLLGRPWLHEHGIVASTLHQCLKYYRGGERKINGDVKLFTKAESHFTDSKFFEEDFTPKEMMIPTISSTGKGDSKVVKDTPATIATKVQQPYR